MAKDLNCTDMLAIGFVALLFAPLWLGELIRKSRSYRLQVRRARTQQPAQGWSRTRQHEKTAKYTVYRPTHQPEPAGTYRYGPQSGWPDGCARPPEKAPQKPPSAEAAQAETVNARSQSAKRVYNPSGAEKIILASYESVGFRWGDDFARTLEKARGIERCLLLLNHTELAVIACRHGLIDGRRTEWPEVAEHMAMSNSGIRLAENRAVIKIDAFCEITDTTPRWLTWHSHLHCWGYWQDGDHYLGRIKREAPTPSELKAARRRVDDLLAYYVAARSSPPPSASDTLIANWLSEQTRADAGSRRYAISANGAIKPCPAGHRAWLDIGAVENSLEANWLLDQLEPEARRVIKLAFGIDVPGEHATEEISQLIGLDLLTTRQIEIAALAKLRRIAATRLADRSA
jgi:hypothetical protein